MTGKVIGADVVLSPVGANLLEEWVNNEPEAFIWHQNSKKYLASTQANKVAQIYVGLDVSAGRDPTRGMGYSFYGGEILALAVTREFVPQEVLYTTSLIMGRVATSALFANFDPSNPHKVPTSSTNDLNLLEYHSAIGWTLAEPYYGRILDHWEGSITHDLDFKLQVRLGFGFVMNVMSRCWEDDVDKRTADVMAITDVDAELTEFFQKAE